MPRKALPGKQQEKNRTPSLRAFMKHIPLRKTRVERLQIAVSGLMSNNANYVVNTSEFDQVKAAGNDFKGFLTLHRSGFRPPSFAPERVFASPIGRYRNRLPDRDDTRAGALMPVISASVKVLRLPISWSKD